MHEGAIMRNNKLSLALLLIMGICASLSAGGRQSLSMAEKSVPQPFQSLMSERHTLDGTPLEGNFNPDEGLLLIDGANSYYYVKNQVLPSKLITALCLDPHGNIFIGTKDIGIVKFSLSKGERTIFNNFEAENLRKERQLAVHHLAYDKSKQRLYAATTGGVYEIDDSQPDFPSARTARLSEYGEGIITTIALSKSGVIWAGTPNGLIGPNKERFTQKDGLPSNTITTLFFDPDDNLWIGTDAGLVKRQFRDFINIPLGEIQNSTIYDISFTQPTELIIDEEKYATIVKAFFKGLGRNSEYQHEDAQLELDTEMEAMLNVYKTGLADAIIASSDGFFRVNAATNRATIEKEGWFYALCAKETGFIFAFNNEFKISNLSPTSRLISRHNLSRRLIQRVMGQMKSEISGDTPPVLLDEQSIEDLRHLPDDVVQKELEPRVKSLKATAMVIDDKDRLWIALDGGGLLVIEARLNAADFFVKALDTGGWSKKSTSAWLDDKSAAPDPKIRYYIKTTSNINAANLPHEDLIAGSSACIAAYSKKMGFMGHNLWVEKTSNLLDEDWERVASYAGEKLQKYQVYDFISHTAVDPWIFIPAIYPESVKEFCALATEHGFEVDSKNYIQLYERENLPVVEIEPHEAAVHPIINYIEVIPDLWPENTGTYVFVPPLFQAD